eukprot:g61264.t1
MSLKHPKQYHHRPYLPPLSSVSWLIHFEIGTLIFSDKIEDAEKLPRLFKNPGPEFLLRFSLISSNYGDTLAQLSCFCHSNVHGNDCSVTVRGQHYCTSSSSASCDSASFSRYHDRSHSPPTRSVCLALFVYLPDPR